MKKEIILYLVLFMTSYSFCQNNKNSNVFGTWELVETLNVIDSNIDIGELIIYDEEEKPIKKDNPICDSIQKNREQLEKEDPRITKWHYIFEEKYFYEYRFELGGKFKSKIVNNIIYKFNVPFYEIESLSQDTLKLKEYKSGAILVLKKVDTDLSDFKIMSEY